MTKSVFTPDAGYARALKIAITVNALMFGVEFTGALISGSISLMADSIDFLEDAATYWLTLHVLGMSLRTRAWAGLVKGVAMALPGLWIGAQAISQLLAPETPRPYVMGFVGALALVANISCALLLAKQRNGDSNIRSAWLSSRNDAIANIAIILGAFGVSAANSPWPDLMVGLGIAWMNLYAAIEVIRLARSELHAT